MPVFAAFVNGLKTETLGSAGLEEVEMAWLHEFRKKLASALDVGRFLEMWNIRETHPKGGPVRTLVRYRMCAPDHQTGTHSTQSSSAPQGIEHEGPAPPTNNERKNQSHSQNRWPYGVLERKTRSSNELLFSSGVTPLILCEEF